MNELERSIHEEEQMNVEDRLNVERPVSRRQLLGTGLRLGGAGLAVGGLPALLSACGSDDGSSATSASTDAQLILQTPNNAFFKQWILGFELACAALQLKPHIGYSDGDNAKQVSVLQSALARGAKYINTPSPSDTVVNQVARLSKRSGAWFSGAFASPPWKMLDADYDEHYSTFLQTPDYKLTYELGKRLFKEIGGKGKVGHLKGLNGQGVTYVRAAGYQRAAKEFPDIQLIEDFGNFNRVDTEPVFAAMLSAHPDIKGVVAASDDSSMGCISVLRSRKRHDVRVVSIDAIPEFLTLMQKDQYALATASILGTWLGAFLLVRSYDAANGVDVGPLERMLTYGAIVIQGTDAASAYMDLVLDESSARKLYDADKMSRHRHPKDWQPQNSLAAMDPLDAQGTWLPEAQAGYGQKPDDWKPSDAWSKAAANGGLAKVNDALARRAAANDPLKSIRSKIGHDIL
jgi:ABC-type sugar transport system substrate-binding protein